MMGFLVRNWHLKLSAVLLATVLYTGLVFSDAFAEDTIEVRIEQVNAPAGSYVLSGDLGVVTVRYRASNETTGVAPDAFVARVDLSAYDMERAPDPQVLDVTVTPLIEGIQVQSVNPDEVRVEIDRIEVRTVPVEVDAGTVPATLEIEDPQLSEDEVQVRGPSTAVARVDRAVARIHIDDSGIGFNQPVDLVPVDVEGREVTLVDVEPETISVEVEVNEVETTLSVPVLPTIEGSPAAGFALTGLSVEPSNVTLRGLPEVLADIAEVRTEPVSIDGATASQTFDATLVLPEETELAEGGNADGESIVTVEATIEATVSSRTFVVGVVCQGAGQNLCAPGLDQVSVTLSGPLQLLADLAAGDVTPVVDATGLGPGSYSLTPAVAGLPAGVDLLELSPGTIPVTITAPATPAPTPAP